MMEQEVANDGQLKASQRPTESLMMAQPAPLNNDYCYVCKDRGNLFGCDNCHRAYHFEEPCCLPDSYLNSANDDGQWICPCCDQHQICPICEKEVRVGTTERTANCALCYRSIHLSCIDLPESLQKANQLVVDYPVVNCINCLRSSTIKHWMEDRIVDGREYSLLIPLMAASCHQGWLETSMTRQIMSSQKHRPQQVERSNIMRECRIAKILNVKPPHKYKRFDKEFVLETLSNSKLERKYGSQDNFRFLVKWVTVPAKQATWEDEAAVFNERQALSRYLAVLRTELTLEEGLARPGQKTPPDYKKSLTGDEELFYVVGDGQRNSRLNSQRRRELIDMVNSEFKNYLNPGNPYQHKETIVLTDTANLKQWEADIQAVGKGLIVTLLEGTTYEQEDILDREMRFQKFKLPCFNVLLTTPEIFSQRIEAIEKNVDLNCSLVIFDLVDNESKFVFSRFKSLQKSTLCLFKYTAFEEAQLREMLGNRYRAYGENNSGTANRCEEKERQVDETVYKKPSPQPNAFKDEDKYKRPGPIVSASILEKPSIPVPPKPDSNGSPSYRFQSSSTPKTAYSNGNQRLSPQLNTLLKARLKSEVPTKIREQPSYRRISIQKSIPSSLQSTYQKFMNNPTEFIVRCGVSEVQRVCVLQYLVSFGLNRGKHEQVYQHMVRWKKDVFGCGTNDLRSPIHRQQKQTIIRYLQVILSIIYEDRQTTCVSPIITPLFFEYNHMSLCKHIIEISNAKDMYEEYKNKPEEWPYNKIFNLYRNKKGELITAANWTPVQDLELIRLVLEHGFGNWTNIIQAFMSNRVEYRPTDRSLSGQEYLLNRLRPTFKPLATMSELSFCARMINNRMSAMLSELWCMRRRTN